jgi:hypothetical protein
MSCICRSPVSTVQGLSQPCIILLLLLLPPWL